ncbi:MAG: CorA family divalent cation transporter [Candidatus Kariarchaeaceae archaeon]|jgi:Mg2+ and Co2+ transporter CorA
MPRTLVFDKNSVPDRIIVGDEDNEVLHDESLAWVHLPSSDDIRRLLPDIIDKSRGFMEDLIEEQRPRVAVYQTQEDNDATFSVIVLSIPKIRIFEEDNFQLQVTFILLGNKIFSVGSTEVGIFPEIMTKMLNRRRVMNYTQIFAFIVSELLEMSIKVTNSVEEFIDHSEGKQLNSNLERGWLASLLTLKSRLFDGNKLIRADLEHIREIMEDEVPEIDVDYLPDYIEDRILFLMDYIETLREELSNLINLNLAISNQLMQKQFYWLTIIGAFLVIPTVVSGIFGMNVTLPNLTFGGIMLLIGGLTIVFAIIISLFIPRPVFS